MYVSIRLLCILFKRYLVWMFMYTLISRSCGISVYLYDQVMMSMTWMLKDTCMLVFPEVVEYLYTSITESLDIYVCVYIVVRLFLLWNDGVYCSLYEL